MTSERTIVLIKPDAIERRLTAKIISYFENSDFKIVKLRKGRLSSAFAEKLYRETDTQLSGMGNKTLQTMLTAGYADDIDRVFGSKEPYEIGKKIIGWQRKFMTSNDIIAMLLERQDAVQKAREIIGFTDPSKAAKGTVRGDLGEDALLNANREGRTTYNLVHASDKEGAALETALFEKEFF